MKAITKIINEIETLTEELEELEENKLYRWNGSYRNPQQVEDKKIRSKMNKISKKIELKHNKLDEFKKVVSEEDWKKSVDDSVSCHECYEYEEEA